MATPRPASVAQGASLLVVIQIGSRILTFFVNQILLRFLSPELLGVSAQLELFSITVLYFARDSLRVAQQRQTNNEQAVVNIAYIPLTIGIPLLFSLGALYSWGGLADVPYITESFYLFGLSAFTELFVEPFFAICVLKSAYASRARADSLATLSRCFAILGTVIYARRAGFSPGALPFAFGQLAFAVVLVSTYALQTVPLSRSGSFSLLPKTIQAADNRFAFGLLSRSVISIWLNLYVQSGVKYLLTQGDSFLVARLTTLHDQGVYALAANYGGLIARMVFQPIEESSRGFYAKSCAATAKTKKPDPEALQQALNSLHSVLRFYTIVGLAAITLGPTVAPLLLEIVAGKRWIEAGAGDVLANYCYYIPFLAVNGLTEAFVAAVASPKDLRFQSVLMIFYSAAFAGSAYLGLQVFELGANGLILANCINMFSRIIWNFSFIKSFFQRNGKPFSFQSILPTPVTIAIAVVAVGVLKSSPGIEIEALPRGLLGSLVREGGIAAAFGALILAGEREFLMGCYKTLKPKKESPKPVAKKVQ